MGTTLRDNDEDEQATATEFRVRFDFCTTHVTMPLDAGVMFDTAGSAPAPTSRPTRGHARLDDGLIHRLRELLSSNGGFTLDPETAEPVSRGVAVCADPSLSVRFHLDDWSHHRVRQWLERCRVVLADDEARGRYLGGWRLPGTDMVELDIVCVFPTVGQARPLGECHRQVAMFDLADRAVVPLVLIS